MQDLDSIRDSHGDLPAYAWPGGYPVAYYVADGGELCAACANGGNGSRATEKLDPEDPSNDQWRVIAYGVIEAPEEEVRCDHCATIIAFGVDG